MKSIGCDLVEDSDLDRTLLEDGLSTFFEAFIDDPLRLFMVKLPIL